jgi:hypothetical protein
MKKKKFILTLTISLISWLLVIPAGITNASGVFFEIKPKLDINKPPNKEERLAFAKSLYEKINQIADAIPNLSPSQKKWLEAEMSSDNTTRIYNAYESDEKYLKDIKITVELLRFQLIQIIDAKYQGQRQEVFYWQIIASGVMDWQLPFNISELVNRKLITISSDKRFGNREVVAMVFNQTGSSILNAIVTNYLLKRLPE